MFRKNYNSTAIRCFVIFLLSNKSYCDVNISSYADMIPPLYNPLEAPQINGKPVDVYTFLQITDLDEIDESKMQFRINFYIDDIWRDPRLKLEGYQESEMRMLPVEVVAKMWKPDIVFDNAKSGGIFKITIPNTFIKVLPDGAIYRTSRYSIIASCPMSLLSYPMDSQYCQLVICSLSNPTSIMRLHWIQDEGSPYTNVSDNIELYMNFQPLKYDLRESRAEKRVEQWVSGNFTYLIANFTFVRSVSSHIMNTYVPSTLVVFMSWLSFWLDVSVAPGRVTLGVTSLLTLATQGVRTRNTLPPLNYMTALDVWLFFCVIMVFASLVEYAIAYHIAQREANRRSTATSVEAHRMYSRTSSIQLRKDLRQSLSKERNIPSQAKVSWFNYFSTEKLRNYAKKRWKFLSESSNTLDLISRVAFPLSFFVFCSVYWPYYVPL